MSCKFDKSRMSQLKTLVWCVVILSLLIITVRAEEEVKVSEPASTTTTAEATPLNDSTLSPFSYYRLYDFVWNITSHQFTFILSSNVKECVFQEYSKDTSVFASYEVVASGSSSKKISFRVREPTKKTVLFHKYNSTGYVDLTVNETETWEFCLYNAAKFSGSRKVMFTLDSMISRKVYENATRKKDDPAESSTEITQSVQNSFYHMALNLFRAMDQQRQMRSYGAKDVHMATSNQEYVQRWALLHIFLVVGTAFFQVTFVRRLFMMPVTSKVTKIGA